MTFPLPPAMMLYPVSALSDANGRAELRATRMLALDRIILESMRPLERWERRARRFLGWLPFVARALQRYDAKQRSKELYATELTSVRVADRELLVGPCTAAVFTAAAFGVRWNPEPWGLDVPIVMQFKGNRHPLAVLVLSRGPVE